MEIIMELLEIAKKRHSVRKYTGKEVEQEKLDKILEAAHVAPTAANMQPVRLIVVKSKEGLEKVGKAANIYQAPAAIVVCADKTKAWKRPFDGKITTDIDASILTDHMMLEATELGLGSVWICYFNPERHIDCGIAEANMTGIAAGLSTCGKVPFVSTFAMFAAGRAYEQVRNSIGYPHLNVKIGATHAGISVGEDGATHQCNEDIGLMREIPGIVIINPSDDVEARAAVRAAYEYVGPVYLRFGRLAVPVINDNPEYKFEIGKGVELRKGKDITIFATGLCVSETLKAAETLAADGIDAQVINIHTIKPLDEELVLKAAKQTGRVYTVEEHSIIGGLGSAVAELLGEKCPTKITRIGVKDVFGESGPAKVLLHKYELDAEGIAKRIMEEQKSC